MMLQRVSVASLLLLVVVSLSLPVRAQSVAIEVESGDLDRIQTPVSALVTLPESFGSGKVVILKSADGLTLLGQITEPSLLAAGIDDDASEEVLREIHFILPELAGGETARFDVSEPGEDLRTIPSFTWEETEDGDLLARGDDAILLYVRPELDESSPEARELTFKPFHHLFAPDGRRITKGAGGLFTHHRGLFFGYNKVGYGDGKEADVWHARGKAYQAHRETISRAAGPVLGRHQVQIGWHGQEGELFALEHREVTAYAAEDGYIVDFAARVETKVGPVTLDGDPQHAGVHVRADNHVADVSKDETYYLRPDGPGEKGETRNWEPRTREGPVNLPWNAMSFSIEDDRYTVVYMDHPENPKEARYSERDYGRFGSYFEYELTEDRPLNVRYRLWLQSGELSLDRASSLDADFDEPVTVRLVE